MKLGMTKRGGIAAVLFWMVTVTVGLMQKYSEGTLRPSSYVIYPLSFGLAAVGFGLMYSYAERKKARGKQ